MADSDNFSPQEWDQICLTNLLGATSDHAYFKDSQSRFIRVSAGVLEAAGRPRAELRGLRVENEADLIGKSDFDLFTPVQAREAFDAEQKVMRTESALLGVVERQTWPDRPPTYVMTNKMPLRAPDGSVVGTFGFSRDVTDDLLLRRQLSAVLANSPDGICRFDTQLRYVFVNPAAQLMLGLPEAEILGKTDHELGRDPAFVDLWRAALTGVIDSGDPGQLEHRSDDGPTPSYYESRFVAEADADVVTGVLVLTRDITYRKRVELMLTEQAVRDPLTGLANRVLLLDRLTQSLVRLERSSGTVAVLFMDLDKFKVINDSLGHAFGDALLKETANRLLSCARRSDTVARFGGDEFVMLCDRVIAPEDAQAISERITRALAVPFSHDGHVVQTTASIGIATTSDPHASPIDLVRDADTAMYQAKERAHGGASYQFFDVSVRERAAGRMQLETELRAALGESRIRLHYQPLHVLSTGELHGVEALVRLAHPTRGLILPIEFIPVAEKSDLIIALGAWVLDEACRQLGEWNTARVGRPPITMAVNISARQLDSPDLVGTVARALKSHGVEPRLLCLEISEQSLREVSTSSSDVLLELHELGVLVALDDFGSGYSSLGQLRRFPVDILKVDEALVSELADGTGDNAIVGAITAMAHALGMTTVGQGVENAEQLASLRLLGCDDVQGYLLASPMPAEELAPLLGIAP